MSEALIDHAQSFIMNVGIISSRTFEFSYQSHYNVKE
jgi:hypothetical protein